MNEWIDEKIKYLNPIVKQYTIFEPTSEFYKKLEKIDIIPPFEEVLNNINENRPPYVTFFEATKSIEKHLGWSIPRIEFHPLQHNTDVNGNYIAGKIQIGGNFREIQISSDYKKKAQQLGTILAHEIAHDFLFSKGIKENDINENEKLTDLTAIMLGLGKLTLNGIEERMAISIKKLCYLPASDLAYAYVKVNSLYKIPTNNYFTNLTNDAYCLVIPYTGNITLGMNDEIKEKCSIIQYRLFKLNEVYYQIRDYQDLINKNIVNIKIEPEDGNLFIKLNSFLFQQEFENLISNTKLDLTEIKRKLESEYNYKAGVSFQCLRDLDIKISQKNNEVNKYLEKLFEIINKQEKYLHIKSNLLDDRFQENIKAGRVKDALKFARKEDWRLLNNLGVKFAKKKDIIAFDIFDKNIQLDPNNATAYYNRGKLNQSLNKEKLAIGDYHKSIELEPNNATVYYNCGNVHFKLGEYLEAIGDYNKSIELEPNNAKAYYNCGDAHYFLGQFLEAIGFYHKYIEFEPNNAKAYSNCGDAHYFLGQYLEAIKDYQMAIKFNPNNGIFYESLEKVFNSLKQRYPNNPMVYVSCGNAYSNFNQYFKAIKEYQMAIKLDPRDAMSFYNCGNAQFNLGQYLEAIKNYQIALKLNPSNHIFHESLEKAFKSLKKREGLISYIIIKIKNRFNLKNVS